MSRKNINVLLLFLQENSLQSTQRMLHQQEENNRKSEWHCQKSYGKEALEVQRNSTFTTAHKSSCDIVMFSDMSVCLSFCPQGVPYDHYPWCIRPQHTGTPQPGPLCRNPPTPCAGIPLDMFKLVHFGPHCTQLPPGTSLSLFIMAFYWNGWMKLKHTIIQWLAMIVCCIFMSKMNITIGWSR